MENAFDQHSKTSVDALTPVPSDRGNLFPELSPRIDIEKKNEFIDRIEQLHSSKEPGLDPIIAKGSSLIKDLDTALKNKPEDSDYREFRVHVGMRQVDAYVNSRKPDGGSAFEKEAKAEIKNILALQPRMYSSESMETLTKRLGIAKDEDLQKTVLQAKVDVHPLSEINFSGTDPIIMKGNRLIKELDELRKTHPTDADYEKMRVSVGLNQVNAYVHSADRRDGSCWFGKEAKQEMTNLMTLKPDLARDTQFKYYVDRSGALNDPAFETIYKKNGGK